MIRHLNLEAYERCVTFWKIKDIKGVIHLFVDTLSEFERRVHLTVVKGLLYPFTLNLGKHINLTGVLKLFRWDVKW